ncbi:hypothetical protein [Devosia marina]|uniref:Uncharacterized protein n=1 Tax=Devosia marina TaxID=2683198 RepID=A0A7X3K3Q7_9HYPH|nr:hypothetical protein [Devosia marina]MVS99772.1 hypothetical protein [Devosia marina]
MLTKVEEKFGTMPIAALEDKRVRGDFMDWRDEVLSVSGPREADNRISILSTLLSWAVDRTRIWHNHAIGIARLHKTDRSDKLWLPKHVEAFMSEASVEMQRALILALHTGQRQGDLRKSVHTIIEKYMSRTRALAKSAMTKFENASSTDFANRRPH